MSNGPVLVNRLADWFHRFGTPGEPPHMAGVPCDGLAREFCLIWIAKDMVTPKSLEHIRKDPPHMAILTACLLELKQKGAFTSAGEYINLTAVDEDKDKKLPGYLHAVIDDVRGKKKDNQPLLVGDYLSSSFDFSKEVTHLVFEFLEETGEIETITTMGFCGPKKAKLYDICAAGKGNRNHVEMELLLAIISDDSTELVVMNPKNVSLYFIQFLFLQIYIVT